MTKLIFVLAFLGVISPTAFALDVHRAADISAKHGEAALLIEQNGKVLFSRTALPTDSTFAGLSITKGLCALAALEAQREKKLPAVAAWDGASVGDCLRQISGLAPGYATLYSKKLASKKSALKKLPRQALPGQEFSYGPSHYEAVESLMEERLGGARGVEHYVTSKILHPLGISPHGWRRDGSGSPFFSTGIFLSLESAHRLGKMLLNNGRLGSRKIIAPETLATTVLPSQVNTAYGCGFWLNRNARHGVACDVEVALKNPPANWNDFCFSRRAPADLIALVGSGGQRIYISPSHKLVIVRFGHNKNFRDNEFLDVLFRKGK